jgi:hypothetical protein
MLAFEIFAAASRQFVANEASFGRTDVVPKAAAKPRWLIANFFQSKIEDVSQWHHPHAQ